MSLHDAIINIGNGLALSIATGLIFVMLIQPRRSALNIWLAAFLGTLALWAYFAIARIAPNKILFGEAADFRLSMTGLLTTPITVYLYANALARPRNYFEPVLRSLAVVLVVVAVALVWTDNLGDYTKTGGEDLDLSYHTHSYLVLALLTAYSVRSWWLLREQVWAEQVAPALVGLGTLTAFIPALLELPLGTLLTTGAALLVGHRLLRQQLFTPLAEADAQVAQARTETRQAIRDLTVQKEYAERLEDELAEASRYKGQFLTNMGVQLRTPLNSIVGYSELLLKGIYGAMSDKQSDRIEKIHRNGLNLLLLINEILELNKLEGGRLALDLTDIRLSVLAESLLDDIRERAAAKGLDLRLEIERPVRLIRADELRIRQVLLNLLDNAVKFTSAGHVRLAARSITVRDGRSDHFSLPVIGWLGDRHWIVISVEDTGIGIPPEEQAAIFEEFRQAENAARSGYEGAGMGLAIAKKLVELHTGRIWVSSQPDQGSTFYVALPALEVFDLSDATTEYNLELLDMAAILLLVESDEAVAERITEHLRAANYHTVRAVDGPSAIARAHEIKPAAVLVDMARPDLAGWDAIQRLKQDPDCADIPMIVFDARQEEPRGFLLGASACLSTPVQRDEFLAALAHVQHAQLDRPVLVIDNDADDRRTMQQFLTGEGVPVAVCQDGRSALDWLGAADHEPGLVVVDFNMPQVSGFEVLHALRADPRTQGVPVVLTCEEQLSEADRAALGQRIAGALAEGHADLPDLLACVRAALDE